MSRIAKPPPDDPAAADQALAARLLALPEAERWQAVRALDTAQANELLARWSLWAHPGQYAPPGDWRVWLIRAGRGFGKTRAGAEWVCDVAATIPGARIALVGATLDDVAKVMVDGPSGIVTVAARALAPRFHQTAGVVRFANGTVAHLYSAEAAEKLRGPEHHAAWCDELAKWRYGDTAWDNLMLGLRLGDRPALPGDDDAAVDPADAAGDGADGAGRDARSNPRQPAFAARVRRGDGRELCRDAIGAAGAGGRADRRRRRRAVAACVA